MPAEMLDALDLDLMEPAGMTARGEPSSLYSGFRNFELARTDASVATLYNAQSGLFRTTIRWAARPQQAAASIRWSPRSPCAASSR